MVRLFPLLDAGQVARLAAIAGSATWIDGRATNPGNAGKNNRQIEPGTARDESGTLLAEALAANATFNDVAMPVGLSPPLLSRYASGMAYAVHGDNAFIPSNGATIRADLACTIFLADPAAYDGGALIIHDGESGPRFGYLRATPSSIPRPCRTKSSR